MPQIYAECLMWCFQPVLSSDEIDGKFVKPDTWPASTKISDISLCIILSIQLIFVGLIIIIFVNILKVGSVDLRNHVLC